MHWSELEVWQYIQREQIPVVPLYFARQHPEYDNKLMRFRSIGEKGITFPVESTAVTLNEVIEELEHTRVPERSGRPMGADEDESSFERLRTDGYM